MILIIFSRSVCGSWPLGIRSTPSALLVARPVCRPDAKSRWLGDCRSFEPFAALTAFFSAAGGPAHGILAVILDLAFYIRVGRKPAGVSRPPLPTASSPTNSPLAFPCRPSPTPHFPGVGQSIAGHPLALMFEIGPSMASQPPPLSSESAAPPETSSISSKRSLSFSIRSPLCLPIRLAIRPWGFFVLVGKRFLLAPFFAVGRIGEPFFNVGFQFLRPSRNPVAPRGRRCPWFFFKRASSAIFNSVWISTDSLERHELAKSCSGSLLKSECRSFKNQAQSSLGAASL